MTLAVVAAMAVLSYTFDWRQKSNVNLQTYDPQAGLGELGAQCGGDLRLPCKPGLNCVVTGNDDLGICSKISEREPGSVSPL